MTDNIRRLQPSRQHPAADDSYELDDGMDYDPMKFYTKSTRPGDKETVNLQVTIPRSWIAQMEALVQSGKIKHYKQKTDIVRDALHHRLYFVNTYILKDGQLEENLRAWLNQADIERVYAEADEQDQYVKFFADRLDKMWKMGDPASLAFALKQGEEKLQHLREPWQSKLAALLDKYRTL